MQYEEPEIFEIRITQFVQGNDSAPGGNATGGLAEDSTTGDNPFN